MSQVEVVFLSSGHLHEAILYQKYNTSSDLWSYGMLMYEIWSLGHRPFGNKTVDEVGNECWIWIIVVLPGYIHYLHSPHIPQVVKMFDQSDHYCQPPPPGCPRVMYAIMVDCW